MAKDTTKLSPAGRPLGMMYDDMTEAEEEAFAQGILDDMTEAAQSAIAENDRLAIPSVSASNGQIIIRQPPKLPAE